VVLHRPVDPAGILGNWESGKKPDSPNAEVAIVAGASFQSWFPRIYVSEFWTLATVIVSPTYA
jgi:hypothetical protein